MSGYQWMRDRVEVGTNRREKSFKLELRSETIKANLFAIPGTQETLWIPKSVGNIASVGEDPCTVSVPNWFRRANTKFFSLSSSHPKPAA